MIRLSLLYMRKTLKLKSLTIIFLALAYCLSLAVPYFIVTDGEKKVINNDYSIVKVSVLGNECRGLLFPWSLPAEQENSDSDTDSATDDDEIIGPFIFYLFIHSRWPHLEQAQNDRTSIYLDTPVLPPERLS